MTSRTSQSKSYMIVLIVQFLSAVTHCYVDCYCCFCALCCSYSYLSASCDYFYR